jgi:hypothetical protein
MPKKNISPFTNMRERKSNLTRGNQLPRPLHGDDVPADVQQTIKNAPQSPCKHIQTRTLGIQTAQTSALSLPVHSYKQEKKVSK